MEITSPNADSPAHGLESALAVRILAGDRDAEQELFYCYRDGVAIIVRRITKNLDAAKDVSQETFRLVLEKIRRGELRDPQKISGFVCSIARNLAIKYLREVKREETVGEIETASLPDPGQDQRNQLLKKEKAMLIRKLLDEMKPVRDREILLRFYLTEDDKDSICRDLGLSSRHFNRVLFRAKERFRAHCEKANEMKEETN